MKCQFFGGYFTERGVHRNVIPLIIRHFLPVWKWFVLGWLQCNEAKLFFEKHLPTTKKKLQFMNELAKKNGLLHFMKLARNNGCPWNEKKPVQMLLSMDIWKFCNGSERIAALGTKRHVKVLIAMDIWKFCNGSELIIAQNFKYT